MDPERDLHHRPLEHRSIQFGISGSAVRPYVNKWIVNIEDQTERCTQIHQLINEGRLERALAILPVETPYVLSDNLAKIIGSTR
jgi:Domain of unknown function (DUF4291)